MRSNGKVDQGGTIRRTSQDPFGNGYIHSDQDDQEWKVQRRGNCQFHLSLEKIEQLRKVLNRKLEKYPTRID